MKARTVVPSEEQLETRARVAHGNVVNVRPIPTRGVTRIEIEIEIPIESHVEATSLLFDKDVLIVGVKLPQGVPYGITDGTAPSVDRPSPGSAGSSKQNRSAVHSVPAPAHGGLGRRVDNIDIVKWLGTRCTEARFQEWLKVRTEAAAVASVREICGVESRADIARNPAAKVAFMESIYTPYMEQPPTGGPEAVQGLDPSKDPRLAAGMNELRRAS